MSNATCEVNGCERPRFNRGWCTAHWNRVRRTGEPGSAQVGKWRQVGCLVASCERKHAGRGYCDTHRRRLTKRGDPLVVLKKVPLLGSNSEVWVGDAASYAAIHWRLKRYRGPATTHPCAECGNVAAEWAYQHTAVAEQVDPKFGRPYSTDLDDYEPMCRSCHRRFDHASGRRRNRLEWLASDL